MSRFGAVVVVALLSCMALAGCAKKLPPGVLAGGKHVPAPPSEQRVQPRGPVSTSESPAVAPANTRPLAAPRQ